MRPAITETELYSYLVTRHTGRTVRSNIERQLADVDRAALAVLDFRNVPLIDFSCADEVVAKLVVLAADPTPHPRFMYFRGVAEHHVEPIESALGRQGLVAAAEKIDGQPILLGPTEREVLRTWREIWVMGRVAAGPLADRLGETSSRICHLLEELETRALVVRDGDAYLSFQQILHDARCDEPR